MGSYGYGTSNILENIESGFTKIEGEAIHKFFYPTWSVEGYLIENYQNLEIVASKIIFLGEKIVPL